MWYIDKIENIQLRNYIYGVVLIILLLSIIASLTCLVVGVVLFFCNALLAIFMIIIPIFYIPFGFIMIAKMSEASGWL